MNCPLGNFDNMVQVLLSQPKHTQGQLCVMLFNTLFVGTPQKWTEIFNFLTEVDVDVLCITKHKQAGD